MTVYATACLPYPAPQQNVQTLLRDLEQERQRRWEAEGATTSAAQQLHSYETKVCEDLTMQDAAVEVTSRLKMAVNREHDAKLQLQKIIGNLRVELEEARRQTESSREGERRQREAIRKMEASVTSLESQHASRQADVVKRCEEAQLRSAACGKEAELLRCTVRSLRTDVSQLQELLATREIKHKCGFA
ncbi:PREDICTED: leucine-rich repeat and coiled-coil domain-containing protein 1-like [Priapulus caudatus]|uniref:Leucine-rich repeat and coiled-coil domain-containing protein 1-like n=1 Tax=Priapulus caudatus TaxID=37621 RepID=A0ABM1F4Y0_PRICU|nr:PREDICTED: leucine-rich repeat and coiled-coil domain-containing protein 1-like [Priapulus caudatus]